MRVCFLSPLIPSVAYGHRPYSFLTELVRLGHSVTLLCIEDSGPAPDARARLEQMGITVKATPLPRLSRWVNCAVGFPTSAPLRVLHCRSRALAENLRRDLAEGDYDLLHIDRFRLAPYGVEARRVFDGPIVLDFPDALSLYYRRAVENPRHFLKKWIDRRENRVIPPYEKEVLQADLTPLVCSDLDRDRLLEHGVEREIHTIPNMVDVEEFRPRSRPDGEVRGTFTGTLYYLPNIDGLLWLKEEAAPLLKGLPLPIDVIGYGAGSELDSLRTDDRFRMVGYVENMAEHLYQDDIYLCPLRVGAGIRFKLLEAFAAGMATVSTTLGFEGIPCVPGEHLLAADSPGEFAAAIRRLLEDPAERRRIGKNARSFVLERYSAHAAGLQLEALYRSLLSPSSG